jgi:NADH-quinone oxidoreductase subunit C
MDAAAIHARLQSRFGEKVTAFEGEALQPCAVIAPDAIADVAAFVKADPELAFDNLMCLSAVDYPKADAPPKAAAAPQEGAPAAAAPAPALKPARIEVVYHVFSFRHRHTFVLKTFLSRDDPRVPTVEKTWGVANWHEREAFDMMGVVFEGHSDPRRILLPDDWEGHPLRKDWQDPDFYNGLHVKPTAQMAERFLAGEQIGVGPFDFTPPNRHVKDSE